MSLQYSASLEAQPCCDMGTTYYLSNSPGLQVHKAYVYLFLGHVYILMGAQLNKLVLDIGDLGGRTL